MVILLNITLTDKQCEDVVFMGGVVNSKQLKSKLWKSVNGSIINFYSNEDAVLKYILKLAKMFDEPIGLTKIDDAADKRIINYDLTSLNIGHQCYRSKLKFLL